MQLSLQGSCSSQLGILSHRYELVVVETLDGIVIRWLERVFEVALEGVETLQ